RRKRSSQLAPQRGGINISANEHAKIQNIRFEHMTVRNNTHHGVAVKGAGQVMIIACDFSDNGSSVVPGHGLQHNLFLTHVKGCEVHDSRFDTSPWGNGIDITFSSDILVSNCEFARNSLNGIKCADCNNSRILRNLVEGNDKDGIVFELLSEGSSDIEVSGNISQYNGNYGVLINSVKTGTLINNSLIGNGRADKIVVENSREISRK
ncbi:MAG: right-handed parallel beta-helix repeat-containing protein, partial [Methanosarcinaceae archaeon]|nr:right-handed parallel beta-helix repeat-containing protein [Methanosarcinaceae archaeon]